MALGWQADAQERQEPLVFSADSVIYDRDSEVVTAEGRVEVARAERVLLADRVRYDARTGLVRAEGNVSILEPTGDVVFANEVELSDDLKEGFVIGIGVLLADDSRLAANGARRTSDQRTVMSKAVFSACELCAEEPERPPLWQIKAVSVIHDQKAHRIEYRDAVLELGGFPIAYTPYFSHPDPSVERKTGFLAPLYGSSGPLGIKFEAPFYIAFAPHRDATLTPLVTGKEGVALRGEYRERTQGGGFELRGSVTEVGKRDQNNSSIGGRDIRGHVDATGRFDLDDTWRTGFDLARSTDDTYLRRYDISSEDTLTTNLFAEGFRGRTYASANAYFFQGLRAEDDPGETPFVAPLLDYSFVSEPGRFGGRYALDTNLHGPAAHPRYRQPAPVDLGRLASSLYRARGGRIRARAEPARGRLLDQRGARPREPDATLERRVHRPADPRNDVGLADAAGRARSAPPDRSSSRSRWWC